MVMVCSSAMFEHELSRVRASRRVAPERFLAGDMARIDKPGRRPEIRRGLLTWRWSRRAFAPVLT